MPEELENLRKKIEEKKASEQATAAKQSGKDESIDIDQVEKIVSKMKKKYREQGLEFEEAGGKLRELRAIIAEGEAAKINVQPVEDLKEFRNPAVRQLGNFYLVFKSVLSPIAGIVKKFPLGKELAYYLYSANMPYSAQQYLAISVAGAVLAGFFGLLLGIALWLLLKITPLIIIVPAILLFIFVLLVILLIPKSAAQRRGDALSAELPFALRHMATELKAGIGLYRTLQAVATSDYGVLSQEFSRTISEIEEGTDTKDALRHFALRTQSKNMRSALLHIIRAIKTGGNLSDTMGKVAEDVSFELRMKVRDFAEKMNFFGVIFIFGAIVAPVFIAVLGSIVNAPLGLSLGSLPLTPVNILIIYLVAMPLALVFLIFYLKMIQPKV
jgi:flagellar protein FlaJ